MGNKFLKYVGIVLMVVSIASFFLLTTYSTGFGWRLLGFFSSKDLVDLIGFLVGAILFWFNRK
jgi:hypothetical protein